MAKRAWASGMQQIASERSCTRGAAGRQAGWRAPCEGRRQAPYIVAPPRPTSPLLLDLVEELCGDDGPSAARDGDGAQMRWNPASAASLLSFLEDTSTEVRAGG